MSNNLKRDKIEEETLWREENPAPEKKSWIKKYSESDRADWWLAIFSFAEASFLPIPSSALLIATMTVKDRHKQWFYYGSLVTIASVLGGLFGYLIGFLFYDTLGRVIIEAYGLRENILQTGELFRKNAFLAIFFASATPLPYKVFTLASGFFRIDPFIFILTSLLGRGLMFYTVAALVSFLGHWKGKKVMKYLNYLALSLAFVALGYFVYKILDFAVF
ncbi:cytochrome B [Candidatus Campbellbacteria bacterium CG11_big_fil_rev_8_21_14_0_20_44_21]|uniref:Cytochrome B n=1 Tax=Candidatus Campbellbacteria bacterium CG22_combo_CG10-13_8_21_14_all_43_18 TaxID=1974530 RepID=A0A2H0DWV2_9BACT|nr:MAG: cytochrome B [Candidatus Campbellbacteria bacterium CG22_combo_CG10-13_8_21_14_all_43_18]PIR24549.1 MAG: cytochrome B [Candidatus Campbellbacteria bacterium CG11_big_fil_rev_8_21_14_0_20_44_21]